MAYNGSALHKVGEALSDWYSLEKLRQAADVSVRILAIIAALQAAKFFSIELQARVEKAVEGYLTFDEQRIEQYLGEEAWMSYLSRASTGDVLSCLARTRYPVYPKVVIGTQPSEFTGFLAPSYFAYQPSLYKVHDDNGCYQTVGLRHYHQVIKSLSRSAQEATLTHLEEVWGLDAFTTLTSTLALESLPEGDVERLLGAFVSATTVGAVVVVTNTGSMAAEAITITWPSKLESVGDSPGPIALRAGSSRRYRFQSAENQLGKWTPDDANEAIDAIQVDGEPVLEEQIKWRTIRQSIILGCIVVPLVLLGMDYAVCFLKMRRTKAPPKEG
jgi:hypothetical protein